MNLKKKGISPLIATVLIIGFTVALAAIIITWATGFTRNIQSGVEETAGVQTACATDVVFDIKSVCYDKTDKTKYKILVQNDGKEPIIDWKVRLFASDDNVEALPKATFDFKKCRIGAFGISSLVVKSDNYDGDDGTTAKLPVKKIEIFPVIIKSGKEITCANNVASYGSTDSSGIRGNEYECKIDVVDCVLPTS